MNLTCFGWNAKTTGVLCFNNTHNQSKGAFILTTTSSISLFFHKNQKLETKKGREENKAMNDNYIIRNLQEILPWPSL